MYVSGPTLSSYDAIYRVDVNGTVATHYAGFGRPQGLAFDQTGTLFVVEALAGQYQGKVKVGKLDVDHNQRVAGQFGVRSIPTLLLFKGGKVVEQLVGAGPNTRAKLEEAFKKAM